MIININRGGGYLTSVSTLSSDKLEGGIIC